MATSKKVNTRTAAAAKRVAPAPVAAPAHRSGGTAVGTKAAVGTAQAQAQAPQAPLFIIGTLPPVLAGTRRAYAQATMRTLAAAHPAGFTLAMLRAALVANANASSIAPPTHGWLGHNMPTWASHANQAWLVRAG